MGTSSNDDKQGAESAGASSLSGLIATAVTRHHQIKTRFIIALIGAGLLAAPGYTTYAMVWFAAVVFSQWADTYLWAPFRDRKREKLPTRKEWIMVCVSSAQAGIVYSLLPVMLWGLWGVPGKVFAMVWLCGALLHVTMHMHHEIRTFVAAAVPQGLYFLGLPTYALVTGAEPGRAGAIAILIAGLLYLGHLAIAFKEYKTSSADMRQARELAQVRQAAAEQANDAKSVFLANISHEIRTPMNGILGMAAALDNSALTDEQRGKLKIIRESGDLLMSVLNDLLDFSKIEANHIEFECAAFDLREVARQVENLHSEQAAKKGLEFKAVCEGGSATRRMGDAHRIVQVLHNLVANAIKFTAEGSVQLRIRAPEEGDADSSVFIEVSDTGIGISDEQLAKIFDPFTQADVTTTRKYGGTGLGLSIAQGLIHGMGGTIGVRSTIGGGTNFVIELPLRRVGVARDDEQEQVQHRQSPKDYAALKVLAAEDNAVNQAVLKTFLLQDHHVIEFVGDGLQAVEAYKRGQFDLILMDISMPVMDGAEAMRQIRFLERENGVDKPIPIIAVSAHAMRQQIEANLAAGFDGYVTKPVNAAQLHEEIARVMSEAEGFSSEASVA